MDNSQMEMLLAATEDVSPLQETMTALALMVTKLENLNIDIAKAEETLEELQKEKRVLVEDTIPSFMTANGITEVKLDDGRKLSYKEEYHTHVSEANKPRAWAWLRENGLADIIKSKFDVTYTAGQAEKAEALRTLLHDNHILFTCKEDVHPQTLKATVKGLIADGNMPPQDIFGIYQQKTAVIKKR